MLKDNTVETAVCKPLRCTFHFFIIFFVNTNISSCLLVWYYDVMPFNKQQPTLFHTEEIQKYGFEGK